MIDFDRRTFWIRRDDFTFTLIGRRSYCGGRPSDLWLVLWLVRRGRALVAHAQAKHGQQQHSQRNLKVIVLEFSKTFDQ